MSNFFDSLGLDLSSYRPPKPILLHLPCTLLSYPRALPALVGKMRSYRATNAVRLIGHRSRRGKRCSVNPFHSQERSISNFPCMQSHKKYNITHYEELGFSWLTQMKDNYTTNSHNLTNTFLFKRLGEFYSLISGVKGLIVGHRLKPGRRKSGGTVAINLFRPRSH